MTTPARPFLLALFAALTACTSVHGPCAPGSEAPRESVVVPAAHADASEVRAAAPGRRGLESAVDEYLAGAALRPWHPNTGFPRAAAAGGEGTLELSKETQNPIASLISVPLQNNIGFNAGPENDESNYILNIQPVFPFELNEDWNLIFRTIIPVVYVPSFGPGLSSEFGLSDAQMQFYFVPAKGKEVIWGVGPLLNVPTATDRVLGGSEWGLGINAVVVVSKGKWVYGVLATSLWGLNDTNDLNSFLLQYFVNYNLKDGWSITTAPTITADWNADSDNRWMIPVGIGVAKIFHVGKQPMKLAAIGYGNVERPDGAPEAVLQVTLTLLFPK